MPVCISCHDGRRFNTPLLMSAPRKIWITWERHRRTSELAKLLPGLALYVMEMNASRWARYPCLLLKTLRVLLRCRPELVFVQNPSVILSFFAVAMKSVLRFRVVVDAHNEGLRPFSPRHNWLLPLYRWIQRGADLTIVTNEPLAGEVAFNGGTPFVLEDPIPQLRPTAAIPLKGTYNIVFVCTFEKDEPYEEVIESAKFLESTIFLYITGRCEKASRWLVERASTNVVFSGFVPEQEYVNLLHSADIIMDLTRMQNCLVCGAYEAVALEKPMIISDTPVLRSYFHKGAVYTANSARGVADSVYRMIAQYGKFECEIKELKKEIEAAWEEKIHRLRGLLGIDSTAGRSE